MTSTFRLIKAEFKKIFKRPSIFIMAIILVATVFISLFTFNPTVLPDSTITYETATNSSEYYNLFYNNSQINSKSSIDKYFIETDTIINYYDSLNNNTNLLNSYYSEIIQLMKEIEKETNTTISAGILPDLKESLNNFKTAYLNLEKMQEFHEIIDTTLTQFDYKFYPPSNYYTSNACINLNKFIDYVDNTNKNNINELVEIYNKNDYKSKLHEVLNNGINFILTTIRGLSEDFDFYYIEYISTINNGISNGGISKMKIYRNNLKSILTTLKTYINNISSLSYPVILLSDSLYKEIDYKITEALSILDVTITEDSNISTHNNIKTQLDSLRISNFLKDLAIDSSNSNNDKIQQIHLKNAFVKELQNIKTKVDANKTTILAKIDTLKADESITNISKSVTDYSLLQSSYNEVILNKIYLNITNGYDNSIYTNFHGHNFETFNKYTSNEIITKDMFYINNNIYSNSYLNNFAYNQNSGNKTNVFDFVYFTMELCFIVIVIFAIMLMCSLFTGETESGTIKLLLVRPYKRSKIITAKLLSAIFFVLTFTLFSVIISFMAGLTMYGYTTTPVLAVFNGVSAFTISPIILMIINVLSLIFDAIFFVILALMIAILCKNYAASITCSLVILAANFVLNILFGGAFWYSLLPGMNLHLFKYFGNSFLLSGVSSNVFTAFIQSALITSIESSMTFWFSLFLSLVYIIVFIAISYSVFRKRDF